MTAENEQAEILISKFLKLDTLDRLRVMERVNTMLEDEKYKAKRKIQGQTGNTIFVDFQQGKG